MQGRFKFKASTHKAGGRTTGQIVAFQHQRLFAAARCGSSSGQAAVACANDDHIIIVCPAMELLAANHTAEDIATLRTLCGRAALAVEGKTEESFAEALYYYHRTLMKLSGNTITPLILNALITAVLPFWSEYEQTNGVEAALQGLVHFTDLVEQGEGEQAAQLLRDGIRRHKEEHGYL